MSEGNHYWDNDKQKWIDQDNLMIGDEDDTDLWTKI